MATRRNSRKSAQRRHSRKNRLVSRFLSGSLYGRRLRYEPLEDRRLLALVTVTTLADTVDFEDGVTSLREAISATNVAVGADTIDFAPSLMAGGPATIRLTQGSLTIAGSLTIDGPGAGLLTIDASGNDPTPTIDDGRGTRIFDVSGEIVVSIRGLTLTGGDSSFRGGAILSKLADFTIQDSVITGNASREFGGGVYATHGAIVVESTVVSDNLATGQGGPGVGGGGLFIRSSNLTIRESVISGNTAQRGGGLYFHHFYNPPTAQQLVIINSTVSGNQAFGDGGGIWAQLKGGVIRLEQSIVEDNTAGRGGGIYADLTNVSTTISGATIRNNTALAGGGASFRIYGDELLVTETRVTGNRVFGSEGSGGGLRLIGAPSATAVIRTSTIDDNSAMFGSGGGIFNSAVGLTVESSTVSGNTSSRNGGGIFHASGPLVVSHSTIVGNFAGAQGGGGIFISDGGLTSALVEHSIVAANRSTRSFPSDILRATFGSSVNVHHSLISSNIGSGLDESPLGAPDDNGNRIGGLMHGAIDPLLGPLANNGGPTLTHALLPGSPAINAGDLNSVAGVGGVPKYDQRGEPFTRIVNGRIDIGAFEYQSPSDLNLLVDTLVDESDGDHGRGDLSLREAIELANKWSSNDTIRFDQDLAGGMILLTRGELKITSTVSIVGLGAELLTIDASGNDPTPELNNGDGSRIFHLERAFPRSSLSVSMSGLTLTGGDVGSSGGAILGREHLVLNEMVIVDNATREYGGGVFFIDENSAIQNTLEIRNSTISGNTSQPAGGGVAARMMGGTLTFAGNVISGNKATGLSSRGGGIYTNLRNTSATIVGNTVGENSAGFGGGIWANNVIGQMLIDGSRIVGNSATSPKGEGGGIVFRGDSNVVTLRNSIVDNNAAIGIDGRGGGIYATGDAAVIERCTITGNQAGRVGGGIYNRSALKLSETTVTANSAINTKGLGGGVYHVGPRSIEIVASIVSGNSATLNGGGVFITTNAAVTSTIDGSTIGGNSAVYDGGGIFVQYGRLELNNSTIAENSAGRDGGGVTILGGAATITGSTINNNTAGANGGGVASRAFITTLINSTVSQNRASLNGGGLWTSREGAMSRLSYSTIAFNRADQLGGGVFVNDGSLGLNHTIVAHNVAQFGRDLSGLLGASINASYSLVGSRQGSGLTPAPVGLPDANGNLIGGTTSDFIDARLGALADNGGPTKTHALLFGSPAINAGNPAAIAGEEGVPQYDQRGEPYARVRGGQIDIGAFEFHQGPLLVDYNSDGSVNAADYVAMRKLQGVLAWAGSEVEVSQNGIVVSNEVAVADSAVQVTEAAVNEDASPQIARRNVARTNEPLAVVGADSIASAPTTNAEPIALQQSYIISRPRLRFDLLADVQSVRTSLQPKDARRERDHWMLEPTGSELRDDVQAGAVDAVFECFDGATVSVN